MSPIDIVGQKLEALRELQAEKARRDQKASAAAYERTIRHRGEIPVIVLDEPDKDAQRARLLAELGHPEYHIEHHIIDPSPAVETVPYAPDHADARDVTPYRPPAPAAPPPPSSSARSLPPAPGAGALSADPRRMNIPPQVHSAQQRRERSFQDDQWGDPTGWPIRYPRGNRNGW